MSSIELSWTAKKNKILAQKICKNEFLDKISVRPNKYQFQCFYSTTYRAIEVESAAEASARVSYPPDWESAIRSKCELTHNLFVALSPSFALLH